MFVFTRSRVLSLLVGVLLSFCFNSNLSAQVYTCELANPSWLANGHLAVDILLSSSEADVRGFNVTICISDPNLNATGMNLLPDMLALNGGMGPDDFIVEPDPIGGSGITCGTVFSFNNTESLGPFTNLAVVEMTYEAVNLASYAAINLSFCDSLGSPPTASMIDVGGQQFPLVATDLTVIYNFEPMGPFIRGDANQSGNVDIGDAIKQLSKIFSNDPAQCETAYDANGDNRIDLADAVTVLSYVFAGADPLGAPFPACAIMPSSLRCEYPLCP